MSRPGLRRILGAERLHSGSGPGHRELLGRGARERLGQGRGHLFECQQEPLEEGQGADSLCWHQEACWMGTYRLL